MMKTAVEHEIEWGQYITRNAINGLSNEIIDLYIKYLSNERLRKLGLEVLYPEVVEHPMRWVESFSNMNGIKTDFFRAKGNQLQQILQPGLGRPLIRRALGDDFYSVG